jgi:SAM-dependent methyltransferase
MDAWGTDVSEMTYENNGNGDVVGLVPDHARKILDVGCGAGGNARLLKTRTPQAHITGVTASQGEARAASDSLDRCFVHDVEAEPPSELTRMPFDTIIFSHVLEHLRRPEQVVRRFSELLEPAGTMVIAVPNIAWWRERVSIALGRFEYTDGGTMDSTHLRFFTVDSAPRLLLSNAPVMKVTHVGVTGSVPLWPLRRVKRARRFCESLDLLGCKVRPNLFGSQILIRARKELS